MTKSDVFNLYPDLVPLLRCIDRYEWLVKSSISPEACEKYIIKLKSFYEALEPYYADPVGSYAVSVASRIVEAYRSRLKRLRHRIAYYLSLGPCLFVTLTFTDQVLGCTTYDTRKSYVRRWCKSVSSCYVANVDYGRQSEREHYHAVILSDGVDYASWKYGIINFERVRVSSYKDWRTSGSKLSRYTAKLALHSLKDSTNHASVIYSRGKIPDEVFKTVDISEVSHFFS